MKFIYKQRENPVRSGINANAEEAPLRSNTYTAVAEEDSVNIEDLIDEKLKDGDVLQYGKYTINISKKLFVMLLSLAGPIRKQRYIKAYLLMVFIHLEKNGIKLLRQQTIHLMEILLK